MAHRPPTNSLSFTPAERRLIARLNTPSKVQRFLNALPYNTEPPPGRATLRSFRGVVKHHTAHCLEATLFAATVLEQHGYPPLVISFESIDELDHVIFVYRKRHRWGSVARSRDPGLHGRKPVFVSPRALAASYLDTYVDLSGRLTGFTVFDLRTLGDYDWRLSPRNVWKVERALLDAPHAPLTMAESRFQKYRAMYRAFKEKYPDRKPLFYEGRERWSPIPKEFRLRQVRWGATGASGANRCGRCGERRGAMGSPQASRRSGARGPRD